MRSIHDSMKELMFHAGNGDHIEMLCGKRFKFLRPGLFGQCWGLNYSLPPSKCMICEDIVHFCTNFRRECHNEGELNSKVSILVVHHDNKTAFVLHPSWCLITFSKLWLMCVTDCWASMLLLRFEIHMYLPKTNWIETTNSQLNLGQWYKPYSLWPHLSSL